MNYREFMSELLQELKKMQEQEVLANTNNIYVRTLSKLLKIEREAIYLNQKGGRNSNLDKVVMDELKKYMESKL